MRESQIAPLPPMDPEKGSWINLNSVLFEPKTRLSKIVAAYGILEKAAQRMTVEERNALATVLGQFQ